MKGDVDNTVKDSKQQADTGDTAEAAVAEMMAALLLGG
jgi:hypothetical protein